MAWPTAADLKKRLDIPSSDWDGHMERLVEGSVAWVKAQVGDWDEETDTPDAALAQAALERAVELATNGEQEEPRAVSKARALLYGHRRRFGIG
jgi:hypothetical protein